MLIMNPDLPLHETYPFTAPHVARALEPQILKETAFSDAMLPSNKDERASHSKAKRDQYDYSSTGLTHEPSIQSLNHLATDEHSDVPDRQDYIKTKKTSSKPPKAFATNVAQDELFLMDSYYKELMKKERAAFERVLASKLNVHEREVERRL